MKVAVIGAGNVGGAVGGAWEKAGHEVTYGLRDPAKKKGAKPIDVAIAGAEVVLLALPGAALVDFVAEHKNGLDGKVLIDATNNFRAPSMHSWTEISKTVPNAHLYRAFNSLGADVFANPVLGGETPDLFYAGPDGPSRGKVERLIEDAGLRPIRVGGTEQVDVVDGVLRLWITLAQSRGRRIAFKLISD
jgi:8-hydroxy-5-deazaflavin:NADPH oxidoreductase